MTSARLQRPGLALTIELPEGMALEADGATVTAAMPGARGSTWTRSPRSPTHR